MSTGKMDAGKWPPGWKTWAGLEWNSPDGQSDLVLHLDNSAHGIRKLFKRDGPQAEYEVMAVLLVIISVAR